MLLVAILFRTATSFVVLFSRSVLEDVLDLVPVLPVCMLFVFMSWVVSDRGCQAWHNSDDFLAWACWMGWHFVSQDVRERTLGSEWAGSSSCLLWFLWLLLVVLNVQRCCCPGWFVEWTHTFGWLLHGFIRNIGNEWAHWELGGYWFISSILMCTRAGRKLKVCAGHCFCSVEERLAP